MSIQCNGCQKTVMWKKPYTQGDKPVEIDGSEHICPAKQTKKFVSTKFQLEQVPEIFDVACTLLETLEEKQLSKYVLKFVEVPKNGKFYHNFLLY